MTDRVMLNVDDVATILGIGRSGAYKLVHQPTFPKIKIGRRYLVPQDALNHWIAAELKTWAKGAAQKN